jgi:hypothetical protein
MLVNGATVVQVLWLRYWHRFSTQTGGFDVVFHWHGCARLLVVKLMQPAWSRMRPHWLRTHPVPRLALGVPASIQTQPRSAMHAGAVVAVHILRTQRPALSSQEHAEFDWH